MISEDMTEVTKPRLLLLFEVLKKVYSRKTETERTVSVISHLAYKSKFNQNPVGK